MRQELEMHYRSMDVKHLLVDEVEHELLIRQEEFSGGDTLDAKRRKLRGVLKAQKESNNFDVLLVSEKYCEGEYEQVVTKLDHIRMMLENKKVKKDELPPYKTRLIHLLFRLVRLKESGFDTLGSVREAKKLYIQHFTEWSSDPGVVKDVTAGTLLNISKAHDKLNKQTGKESDSWSDVPTGGRNRTSTPKPKNKKKKQERSIASKKGKKEDPNPTPQLVDMMMRQVQEYLDRRLSKLRLSDHEDWVTDSEYDQLKKKKKSKKLKTLKKVVPLRSRTVMPKKTKPKFVSREDKPGRKRSSILFTSGDDTEDFEADSDTSSSSEETDFYRNSKPLKRRPRPVADWKLKYDGKDDGKLLNKFLAEVEFMAEAEHLSKKDLFSEAIHLFSGEVRNWYMEGKRNKEFRSWKELITELKLEYQPPDMDYYYEQQATLRRQRKSEKFSDYYYAIKEIFGYMSKPPPPGRKFDIVYRNLRSDYRNALVVVKEIKNLSTLKFWGRKLDAANWYLYRGKENETGQKSAHVNEVSERPSQKASFPPSNKGWKPKDTVGKLNWNQNQGSSSQPNQKFGKPQTKNPSQSAPSPAPEQSNSSRGDLEKRVAEYRVPDGSTCFNCRGKYHHFGSCLKQKEIFCFVCGFHDFKSENCPYCAKNGRKST